MACEWRTMIALTPRARPREARGGFDAGMYEAVVGECTALKMMHGMQQASR